MSSHCATADRQPGATPAGIEFARRWRDMRKAVFFSTTRAVDWNARLVAGDAVSETAFVGRIARAPRALAPTAPMSPPSTGADCERPDASPHLAVAWPVTPMDPAKAAGHSPCFANV